MTSSQVMYFLKLCQNFNVTETANLFHVTQPVVSRQLAALENELGFSLFNRVKRHLVLTPQGIIMRDFFEKAQVQYDNAYKKANNAYIKNNCDISIRIMLYFDNSSILECVTAFQKTYPEAKIYIASEENSCSADELKEKQWDIVFTWKSNLDNVAEYRCMDLIHSNECIIISKNHPLFSKEILSLSDFRGEMLCYTGKRDRNSVFPTSESHIHFEDSFSDYKLLPLPNVSSVLASIQSGLAFTIMETSILPFLQFEHREVPLNNKWTFAVAWKVEKVNDILSKFIQYYLQEVGEAHQVE